MTYRSRKDFQKDLETYEVSLEKKKKWSGEYFDKALGRKFDIIRPMMPLAHNANYEEWKIYFEKYLVLLNKNPILFGSSLGGVFLAKYLSENKLKNKAQSVYLMSPPFDNTVVGEDLVGGFVLKSDLGLIQKNTKNLYLFFARDDEIVPLEHADKYQKKLPEATFKIFKNKGSHSSNTTFPELIKTIKEDIRK